MMLHSTVPHLLQGLVARAKLPPDLPDCVFKLVRRHGVQLTLVHLEVIFDVVESVEFRSHARFTCLRHEHLKELVDVLVEDVDVLGVLHLYVYICKRII